MTQQELADRIGFHASYFSGIENGLKAPTVETLAQIAGAFGITLSELFLGIDQPRPADFARLATALAGQSAERQQILLRILEHSLQLLDPAG
jgi:transcriptional regulator with XRE-family HTH domain